MAVGASFYRNVFLLNQLVPPNDDFKKVFREKMFDKPNIIGFIHVSHYLLNIYDAEQFKKLIEWPILCKKTEAKYRNDVKDYLNVIASENPDIEFPHVVSTHLHHTSGTKFTIIMWKLSQLVVKKYIMRNGEHEIIFAPKLGHAKELVKTYLQQSQAHVTNVALSRHRSYMQIEKATSVTLVEEREQLAQIKKELFDKKQSVAKYAAEARVSASAKQRLADVGDTEIVQMWRSSLDENICYIRKRHAILRDFEKTCKNTNGIISNLLNEGKVLSGGQLEKINDSSISELPFTSDVQHCLHHLYKDNKLVYHNFVHLLALMLHEVYHCLRKNYLTDLSQCLLQIEASTEDTKSVYNVFKTFLTDLKSPIEKSVYCESNARHMSEENVLPFVKNILFTSSPVIKININCADEKNELLKLLQFTPKEIAYKSLFSRYERRKQEHTPNLRTNLLVSRINIDNIVSLDNNEKQYLNTHFLTPKLNQCKKRAGKYCRLFTTGTNKNVKANSSLSLPSTARANSSAIASAIEEMPVLSDLNLDITTKSLFNLSEQSLAVSYSPLPCTPMKQNNASVDTSWKRARNGPELKINKPELDEFTEVQFSYDENKGTVVRTHESVPRRRSISDLVERYKKLLQVSHSVTTEFQNKCIKHET